MSAPPSPHDLQAEDLAREVANDMPSPYCPGRSIASCPSQAARELEDDILILAKQGQDRKQIETTLVARFGQEKMGSDSQSEVLLAIILGSVLALVVILVAARRWLRPAPATANTANATTNTATAPVPPPELAPEIVLAGVSAEELDRLEDELDELDGLG